MPSSKKSTTGAQSTRKAPSKTSAAQPATKASSAKKPPAKKSTAKKSTARKPTAKKPTASTPKAKQAPAKKQAVASGQAGSTAKARSSGRGPASPFSVGDKVVYPHHGAAVIVKKERREFNDTRTDFFVLDVATDQLTLRVPVENAAELGVRPVISKAAARKVFATFKDDPQEAGSNWSRWYKLLTEKINSGDIYQVAEVVRDLTYAQQTKGISPALKRMLSKARLILTSELRFALDISEEEATKRLDRALPKVEAPEGV
jgi:CarD family transcriptional regulator